MAEAVINGRRMHYFERGNGPVALLVHGFPLDATMWLDQLAPLSEVRRVVAVDLRGSGGSGPVTGTANTMELHASDLDALCDELAAEKVDLAGLSMGGYVALAFAELFGHRLRSFALLNTRAGADSEEARAGRDAMAARVVAEGRSAIVPGLEAALLGPEASLTGRARFRSMVERTPYETIVATLLGMRDRPDRSPILDEVTVPSLVLTSEHDPVAPAGDSQSMADRLPDAEFVLIEGVGHLSAIEAPDDVTAALLSLYARADTR